MSRGRAVGAVSGAVFATDIPIHATLVALGFAALLRSSPTAFDVIGLPGTAYLAFLGLGVPYTGDDRGVLG